MATEENFKQERSLIELIKYSTVSNRWKNGKIGRFEYFKEDFLYRFYETDEKGNSYLISEQEQNDLPVLACGFVAWVINYWGSATWEIYEGYRIEKLEQYKDAHKTKPDVLIRDLEREFYDKHRAEEEQLYEQSKAVFDFISEDESNSITGYVFGYFENLAVFDKSYKTFDELYSDAVKCKFILPKNDFEKEALKAIHDLGFIDWLRENKGLEDNNHYQYRKLCTEDNFQNYLAGFETHEELNKQQIEEMEQNYRDSVAKYKNNNSKEDESTNVKNKAENLFSGYLPVEKKYEIMRILHNNLDGGNAREVIIAMKALYKKGYQKRDDVTRKTIIDTFGINCSPQNLSGFLNNNKGKTITENEIDNFIDKLP